MAGYVSKQAADRWNRTAKIVADGEAGFGVGSVPFAESGELPLIFKNVSGIEIPPYACVQLTGTTESGTTANYLNATRPVDITGKAGPYGFNGPTRVAAGALGSLQSGPVYHAIYDSGVQAAGRKYHPIKDSFKLKGAGFGVGCGLWSFVGTDDIIADTIRVKTCAGGEVACDELADLVVGTYRGICGATIAPEETGPVIVTGCDGEVTIDAVNHSGCTFYLGDRISVHVDPCCVAHFGGCSCCGATAAPPDCCERSVYICIAGEGKLLAVDGGAYTWDVAACCDCVGAELSVSLNCTPGTGSGDGEGPGPGGNSTIAANWTYTCDGVETSGAINIASLCDDSSDVELLNQLAGICNGLLNDRWANFVESCEPCGTLPECLCCFELQSFTVGGNCDKSEVPAFVDDVGLTNVTSTNDPFCNGEATTVSLTFLNNSGGDYGGGADPIRFDLTSTVAVAADRPTCEFASDSGTITDDAVGKGFVVEWSMPANWANGATLTRTIVIRNNGCTVDVTQANAQVYAGRGYICSVDWLAVACPGGGGGEPGGEGGGI